jgi:N-methylhydantoinase A
MGYRPVWFSHTRPSKTPVHDRADLRPGHAIAGPAIIEQFDSTSILYPKDRLIVDDAMNLLVEIGQ